MPYSTISVYDPDFTDIHWQKTTQLLKTLNEKYGSPIATDDWTKLKEQAASYQTVNPGFFHLVTMKDDQAVGWLNGGVRDVPDGGTVAFCRFDTLFEETPAEYSAVTATALAQAIEERNCHTLYFMATNRRTMNLADSWHATKYCRLDRYRLMRKNANFDLINSWLEDYPRRFPNLRVRHLEPIPDDLLDDYLELWRQFVNDMPREGEEIIPFTITHEEWRRREEWRKKSTQRWYVIALIDENGRMIGHSNGGISADNPEEMYQAMTGVECGHRGQGLSKWLKAALFTKIGEDFPTNERLVTDMRAVNKPIHTVNAQMGFELIGEGSEYIVTLDVLKAAAQ